jgi:hypothetical protein
MTYGGKRTKTRPYWVHWVPCIPAWALYFQASQPARCPPPSPVFDSVMCFVLRRCTALVRSLAAGASDIKPASEQDLLDILEGLGVRAHARHALRAMPSGVDVLAGHLVGPWLGVSSGGASFVRAPCHGSCRQPVHLRQCRLDANRLRSSPPPPPSKIATCTNNAPWLDEGVAWRCCRDGAVDSAVLLKSPSPQAAKSACRPGRGAQERQIPIEYRDPPAAGCGSRRGGVSQPEYARTHWLARPWVLSGWVLGLFLEFLNGVKPQVTEALTEEGHRAAHGPVWGTE